MKNLNKILISSICAMNVLSVSLSHACDAQNLPTNSINTMHTNHMTCASSTPFSIRTNTTSLRNFSQIEYENKIQSEWDARQAAVICGATIGRQKVHHLKSCYRRNKNLLHKIQENPYIVSFAKKCSKNDLQQKYHHIFDKLITAIKQNENLGQPETLQGNLKGYESRRINKKDRLVYSVDRIKKIITIKQCAGHY